MKKNKDLLEDYISRNRDSFDDLEPSNDVWNKIDKKNSKEFSITKSKFFLIRVAAILLISFTAIYSYIIYDKNTEGHEFALEKHDDDSANEEVIELMEARIYYANLVAMKSKEIEKCFKSYPELEEDIKGDLAELDDSYNELSTDLNENVNNNQVLEAMIQNSRYKLMIIEDVLTSVNC